MATITTFVRRHPVAACFGLTFVLSWGGALPAIGSAGGMRGTTPASDPRFAYALTMLAGPSLTGQLLTALVHGGTGLRECARHLLCPTPPRSLESAQVAVQPHVECSSSRAARQARPHNRLIAAQPRIHRRGQQPELQDDDDQHEDQ